ncbi:MAG: class I SAM-dependent methyltransferase [Porticoccaceae bacterium]
MTSTDTPTVDALGDERALRGGAILSDETIVAAWRQNARPWTQAVRDGRIESRRAVTDRAIVAAVTARNPPSVLDIGCGEGWLARALAAPGISVTGVDVVPELIEAAQRAGGGDFRVASYADLAAGKIPNRFDVAVANFSLLGGASVDKLFAAIPQLLNAGGAFIVQTLHPAVVARGEHPYRDGWREGTWAGIEGDFGDPAPWYFRTLESWTRLFRANGLQLLEIREPVHPATGSPVSAIFIGV